MGEPVRYRVDRAEALRYLGYAGQETTPELEGRIDDLFGLAERSASPGFVWRAFPVDDSHGDIRLVGTTLVLEGRDIYAHLSGARLCAAMAATVGLSYERELRRLCATSALDGAVFGAAGSSLAEVVADACNAEIEADARSRGLFATWRYSPGYGDMPLDNQGEIIRVLEADRRLGISVTDTHLMIPTKSVTAFVGYFDAPRADGRSCADCTSSPDCELRKAGTPCYR